MENQNPQIPPQNIPTEPPVAPQPAQMSPEYPSSRNWLKTAGIAFGILLVIAAIGGGGYLLGTKKNNVPQITEQQTITFPTATSTLPDPTTNWRTYTNNKYGFSFKYPDYLDLVTDTTFEKPSTNNGLTSYGRVTVATQGDSFFDVRIWENAKKLSVETWWNENFNALYPKYPGFIEGEFLKKSDFAPFTQKFNSINAFFPSLLGTPQGLYLPSYFTSNDRLILQIMSNVSDENNILSTFRFTQ